VSDLRSDLLRAAGDVSATSDLITSATTSGRRRLRRRRWVTRAAGTAGLVLLLAGVVWGGSQRTTQGLHIVPAQPSSAATPVLTPIPTSSSSPVSPQRQAASETLEGAVNETLPGWSSTATTLAGPSLDQQSKQNGWFTVLSGNSDPVQVRVSVQDDPGADLPPCNDCTLTTLEDGSRLSTGHQTMSVSSNVTAHSVIERRWADLLTTDGRWIEAEATPIDTPEEPLPDGVTFPGSSPVTQAALATLVQLPTLQQMNLTG
jgi:hypothetical protein